MGRDPLVDCESNLVTEMSILNKLSSVRKKGNLSVYHTGRVNVASRSVCVYPGLRSAPSKSTFPGNVG